MSTHTPHSEHHFTATDTVRDLVIGMSDGLTVPFALAAGLTGAVAASNLIVTAGLAEIAAGSIAMGLGGYLAARGDSEHYQQELKREYYEIEHLLHKEVEETQEILEEYGLTHEESSAIVEALQKRPDAWVKFMMRFELGLEEPDPKRAVTSAATIAGAYIVGGVIPLSPYLAISQPRTALLWSVGVTLFALLGFGYFKGKAVGISPIRSALQTVVIGGIAAATAFAIARLFSHGG